MCRLSNRTFDPSPFLRPRKLCRLSLVAVALLLPGALRAQWTTGSGGVIYYNGGNVGIGTSNPTSGLQVNGLIKWPGGNLSWDGASPANAYFSGSGGIAFAPWNGPAKMFISLYGNVGIGTMNPQYKLAVNGNIGAQDIIVTNTGWSDYVFRPDYRLRPLSEVSRYIKKNGHLPDIPTEAEVKQKGVSLGDMQSKLLAKVEELTLHLIEQEQQNQQLRERLAKLETIVQRQAPDHLTTTSR